MDDASLQRLTFLLDQAVCTGVEYHGGLPNFLFGSRGLLVWSAWRVLENGEIIAGSDSSDVAKENVASLLTGQSVQSVTTQEFFHDLQITFGERILLETFANREDREHWQIAGGPSEMLIAGPGNLWSSF